MSPHYERYPATSSAVRDVARRSSGAGTTINDLQGDVDAAHYAALSEAAGDVDEATRPVTAPFKANASEVTRAALWASSQLEVFADAIDVYNETSTDPRSIEALNLAYDDLDGDPLARGARALDREWERLEAQIDDVATSVASNIDREPTPEEIRDLWAAGNLPVAAISAWPGADLKLTDLPFSATNTAVTPGGLSHLSDQELADALADANLNESVREAILENRPGAVDALNANWDLSTASTRPLDYCIPAGGPTSGMIVGPDGRLYTVTVPGMPPPSDTPVMNPQYDAIRDDGANSGWTTVGTRDGSMAFGDPVDAADTVAWVLSGLGGPMGDWQSIGSDQRDYVTTVDGAGYINDGTQPQVTGEPPVTGPIPESHFPTDPSTRARVERGLGAMDLVTGVLEGLNGAQQAEYNRHYASEVVFQENAEGQTRAVINLYQVQSDGEDLRIHIRHGQINPETGDIERYTPPPG